MVLSRCGGLNRNGFKQSGLSPPHLSVAKTSAGVDQKSMLRQSQQDILLRHQKSGVLNR